MTDDQAILERLRGCIPTMECIPGCTACCGHVPFARAEWQRMTPEQRQRHSIHDLTCSFAGPEGCEVYAERPLICRMFGVTEGLACPRGVPVREKITADQAAQIMKEYQGAFFNKENEK